MNWLLTKNQSVKLLLNCDQQVHDSNPFRVWPFILRSYKRIQRKTAFSFASYHALSDTSTFNNTEITQTLFSSWNLKIRRLEDLEILYSFCITFKRVLALLLLRILVFNICQTDTHFVKHLNCSPSQIQGFNVRKVIFPLLETTNEWIL